MSVSRETRARLGIFEREFRRWNARTNLSSRFQPGDLIERHIEDSLQLAPLAPPSGDWIDVGTGGGFPGAILAALFAENGRPITLVESHAKKAAFLRSVCLAMDAPARVVNERVERLVEREPAPRVVSARAVAPLERLVSLLSRWLRDPGTLGIFPKGRDAEAEIDAAAREWDFDVERHPSRTASDATILVVSSVRPKNGRDFLE